MKAILRLTGCKLRLEEKANLTDLYAAFEAGNMKEYLEVSTKSASDYALYVLLRGSEVLAVIMEAKTDKTFDDNSLAQAIGYFYARKDNCLGRPPLTIVISVDWRFSHTRIGIKCLSRQW